MMQYWLRRDIISIVSLSLYGKKGDKIKLVAAHDAIWIVEKENGERFPVHRREVTHEPVIPDAAKEATRKHRNQ
jgi:hypothetical protein